MGAIQDGWLLYYEDNESSPSLEIDGKLCIVKTVDGIIRTRRVRRGWLLDRWDLETISGEQLFDQYLVWAEPVTLIQPYTLTDAEKRKLAEADER